MVMKRLLFTLVLACAIFSFCNAITADSIEKKEILLRLPLLSQKNSAIITNALDTLNGIKKIEACYPLNVMIIGYDDEKIKSESVILNILSGLEINTTVEKIYSSDIPLIRNKYKITILRNSEIKN
jgi:hypothetical protein